MNQKSEKEKHNYAISVAFFITAIVTFFVASNWYFIISGNNVNTSIFTEIEKVFSDQTKNISEQFQTINQQKNEILDVIETNRGILNATTSDAL